MSLPGIFHAGLAMLLALTQAQAAAPVPLPSAAVRVDRMQVKFADGPVTLLRTQLNPGAWLDEGCLRRTDGACRARLALNTAPRYREQIRKLGFVEARSKLCVLLTGRLIVGTTGARTDEFSFCTFKDGSLVNAAALVVAAEDGN